MLLGHEHFGLMSRRRFVQAAGAAGGLAVASKWLWPSVASATPTASATPRPIPETISGTDLGDSSNTHVFHILPPFPPQNGQYIEPITIFDFEGVVGRTEVTGTGSGTGTGTNEGKSKTYNFDVDMGFMKGKFVGKDGKTHHGTFGFV